MRNDGVLRIGVEEAISVVADDLVELDFFLKHLQCAMFAVLHSMNLPSLSAHIGYKTLGRQVGDGVGWKGMGRQVRKTPRQPLPCVAAHSQVDFMTCLQGAEDDGYQASGMAQTPIQWGDQYFF